MNSPRGAWHIVRQANLPFTVRCCTGTVQKCSFPRWCKPKCRRLPVHRGVPFSQPLSFEEIHVLLLLVSLCKQKQWTNYCTPQKQPRGYILNPSGTGGATFSLAAGPFQQVSQLCAAVCCPISLQVMETYLKWHDSH